MDTKNTFEQFLDSIGKFLKFVGKFVWSFIRAIATVITLLIIFALLAYLISLKSAWIVTLILLLWFVYTNRKKVTTVIAVSMAFVLALMLFSAIKYSLFPNWAKTKYLSSGIQLFNRSFGATRMEGKEIDSFTSYGAAQLDNVSIRGPLQVYGHLDASELKVQGSAKIYGHAELNDVNFNSDLSVYGRIDLDAGTIAGKTSIYGKAEIKKCEMTDLYVYARKIKLESCTVKNIYVKTSKKEWADRETVVRLIDTKVQGNVAFDGENGKVILEQGASVSGKVVGGNVQ